MKIIMVTNEFPPSVGGVQTHVFELSRALVANGHNVLVITRANKQVKAGSEKIDGIDVLRVNLPNSHLFYDFKLSRLLKKYINEQGYEIVHIHGMRPLKACKNISVPVVFTNHTSSFLKRIHKGVKVLEKMRKQLEIANIVLAPSDELVEATLKTGYKKSVKFISNGVDTNKFSPVDNAYRRKLSIPEDAFVVVLARRLVEKNGVLFFAEAIVRANNSDIHVLIAGDGEDRAKFAEIIEQGDCSDRVHFLGAVANEDMPAVFSAADVSVLPSLMEATSIAGLEAMACGLPLIGTNVGGIPVIIDNGNTGFLVEPKSPEAIVEQLLYLNSHKEKAKEMGVKSLQRARELFSWDKIATQTSEVYKSLLL